MARSPSSDEAKTLLKTLLKTDERATKRPPEHLILAAEALTQHLHLSLILHSQLHPRLRAPVFTLVELPSEPQFASESAPKQL